MKTDYTSDVASATVSAVKALQSIKDIFGGVAF